MSLTAALDATVIERAAEAAYVAAMTSTTDPVPFEPWDKLNPYWRRLYRLQAEAIIRVVGGAL